MKISKLLIVIAALVMSVSFAQANSYTRGYTQGCNSAKGYWQKNRYAFNNNYRYRSGWLAGKRDCAKRVYKKRQYTPPVNNYNNNRHYTKSNYRLGYRHGCRTSEYRYTRNAYQYANSRSYRRGWEAGRRACSKRRYRY